MSVTINGWPVLPSSDRRIGRVRPKGVGRTFTVRTDLDGADLGRLWAALILDWHNEVQKVDVGQLDDWGWSPLRNGRASSSVSDHCAGMAIDLNALKAGSQSKTSKAVGMGWLVATGKYRAVREIMKRYPIFGWGGAAVAFGVKTGGEYNNFWDPMHWFVKRGTTAAQVNALIRALGVRPDGTRSMADAMAALREDEAAKAGMLPVLKVSDLPYLSRNDKQVRLLQAALRRAGDKKVKVDGYYGPETRAAVERFQRAQGWSGAGADGLIGEETLRRLARQSGLFWAA